MNWWDEYPDADTAVAEPPAANWWDQFPDAEAAEPQGYLSQLGDALGTGYQQMVAGTRASFNAATNDTADLSKNLAELGRLQREQDKSASPEDRAFQARMGVADKKWEAGDYIDSITDLFGAAIAEPGAAFKTAVQSAPNALVSIGTSVAGRGLGALAGGAAGIETGPGAIFTGLGGALAGGAVANTLMESGPAIFDELNKRTGGLGAQLNDEQIRAILEGDPGILTEGLKKGVTRGATIGLIESLGLYGAGKVAAVPERAAAAAARSALAREGVNVASREAVEAALRDPALKALANKAGAETADQFSKLGNVARWGGASAIETGAAGAGEAGAQLLTEGQVTPSGVAMEMIGDAVMSPAGTALSKGAELASMGLDALGSAEGVPPAGAVSPADATPDVEAEQRAAEAESMAGVRQAAEAARANPTAQAAATAVDVAEAVSPVAPETAAVVAELAQQTVENEINTGISTVGTDPAGPDTAADTGEPAAAEPTLPQRPDVAVVEPVSARPSANLPPRAAESVAPRPDRQGRDTSERDAWDEAYGGLRRGGPTHNDDGTPYQPTVLDEVTAQIDTETKGQTYLQNIDSFGVDNGVEFTTAIKQFLNAGWVWDSAKKRMVNPANPTQTPAAGLKEIREGEKPNETSIRTEDQNRTVDPSARLPSGPDAAQEPAVSGDQVQAAAAPGGEVSIQKVVAKNTHLKEAAPMSQQPPLQDRAGDAPIPTSGAARKPVEVFTGPYQEVRARKPGVLFSISRGGKGQRYTLWVQYYNKDGRGRRAEYLRTLPVDREEAITAAVETAQRVVTGEGAKMAFSGGIESASSEDYVDYVDRGVAVSTDDLTRADLEAGTAPTAIANQNVGFGKYAGLKVSELFEKDPSYTLWLVANATSRRGQEIAAYLERDPGFLAARDAEKAKAEEEASRIKAYEERNKPKGARPISTENTETSNVVKNKEVEKKTQRKASEQIVDILPPRTAEAVIPESLTQFMFPMQASGANAAVAAMDKTGVFLNGDGAGVGKTRQIIGVASHYASKGRPVIIITENAAIGKPWEGRTTPILGGSMAKDSEAMGVKLSLMPDTGTPKDGQIYVTTYHRIKENQVPEGAVVIFDESQNLANIYGDISKETGNWKDKFRAIFPKASRVAFYSATPADKPHQLAYLYKVLGFDSPEAYLAAALEQGMLLRVRKFGKTEQKLYDVPRGTGQRAKLYKWVNGLMKKAGVSGSFIKREISYEGTDVQFHDTVGTDTEKNPWASRFLDVLQDMNRFISQGWRLLAPGSYTLYAAELAKVGDAVKMVQRELAAGRKVVVYFSRINRQKIRGYKMQQTMDGGFERGEPVDLGEIESPVELLREELKSLGIKFAELHGKSGDTSKTAQDKFAKDTDVLLASVESGGTGINLDDPTGKTPRTEVFMFAPYRGISTIQAMGRIWRASTVQDDNRPNRYIFVVASDIAPDAQRSAVLAKKLQLMNASLGGTAVSRLPMSKVSYDPEQLAGIELPDDGEASAVSSGETSTEPLRPVNLPWRLAASGKVWWAKANADLLEWMMADGPERTGLDVRVKKDDRGGYVAFAGKQYKPEDFTEATAEEPATAAPDIQSQRPDSVDQGSTLQPQPADSVPQPGAFSDYLRTVTPADRWSDTDYAAAQQFADTGDFELIRALPKAKRNAVVRELLAYSPEARARQEVADKRGEDKIKKQEKSDRRLEEKTNFKRLVPEGIEDLPDDIASASIGGRGVPAYADTAYMAAVEAGDMEAAQRMVDQAAKMAGYDIGPVSHGTVAPPFTKFRTPTYFGAGAGMYAVADSEFVDWRGRRTSLPQKPQIKDIEDWLDTATFPGDISTNGAPKDGAGSLVSFGQDAIYEYQGYSPTGDPIYALVENWALERTNSEITGVTAPPQATEFPRIIRAYLKIKKPVRLGAEEGSRLAVGKKNGEWDQGLYDRLIAAGHDGAIAEDDFGFPGNNHYIPFFPDQVKSADPITRDDAGNVIPLSQRFNPASSDIRESRAAADAINRGFYSQLARVIQSKMANAASGKDVLGIVSNPQTGIKAEELKWSGLPTFLEGKAKVTKAEVLTFLENEGAVRFEESRSHQLTTPEEAKAYLAQLDNTTVEDVEEAYGYSNDFDYVALAREKGMDAQIKGTLYNAYQVPGGTNYREVVVTMPYETEPVSEDTLTRQWQRGLITEQEYRDRLAVGRQPSAINYTSSHFSGIPNYLAHYRANDRMDSDGKSGTFLEELQSDRHQQAREKGYNKEPDDAEVIRLGEEWKKASERVQAEKAKHPNWTWNDFVSNHPEGRRLNEESLNAFQRMSDATKRGIPDAPFRKTWPLMLFKRALRDAVAEGKDWIGWTTGETQAERYDLSKQVDAIRYEKRKSGDGYFIYADKNGAEVIRKDVPTGELADVVGKDIAQKIVDGGNSGKLEGENLRVGNLGMQGFYDDILPKEVAKYVKQWGGRVERVGLVTDQRQTVQGRRAGGEWSNSGTAEPMQANVALNSRRAQYPDMEWRIVPAGEPTSTWRVEITPAMRKSVAEGQPLFSVSKGGAASSPQSIEDYQAILTRKLGLTNFQNIVLSNYGTLPNGVRLKGFVRAGSNKVFLNLNSINNEEELVDTFLEEASHLIYGDPTVAAEWARLKELVPQDQLDALRAEMEARGYAESVWDEEAYNDIARKLGYEWLKQPAWKKLWNAIRSAVRRIFGLTDDKEINRVSAAIVAYAIEHQQSITDDVVAEGESRSSPFRESRDSATEDAISKTIEPELQDLFRKVLTAEGKITQTYSESGRGQRTSSPQQSAAATRARKAFYARYKELHPDDQMLIGAARQERNFNNALDESTSASQASVVDIPQGEITRESRGPSTDAIFADLDVEAPNSFEAYDAAKRSRLGEPPKGSANAFSAPRYTADQFDALFEKWFAASDYASFLAAIKASDATTYRPTMKKLMRAAKGGDADAAARVEWFRHVISGTVPAGVSTAQPAPAPTSAVPPTPPVAGPPQPPPGVSGKPYTTLNTVAMTWLARKLGEQPVVNRLLRSARGKYNPNSAAGRRIQLHEQLFKDPKQAAKTLAHEIGHYIDAIAKSVTRKGLAGRLAPLGDYKKVFGALWDWSGGPKALNAVIKAEAIALSKAWRGDFPADNKYRNSSSELYADFISAFMNDPMWTARQAPNITFAFLEALDNKPLVSNAYFNLVNLVRGGALYKAVAEDRTAAQKATIDRELERHGGIQTKKKVERAFWETYGMVANPDVPVARKAGGHGRNKMDRVKNLGRDYVSRQQQARAYANVNVANLDNRMFNDITNRLKQIFGDPEKGHAYLDRYLLNTRIIKERTATGDYLAKNPDEARKFFKWLVETGSLGKAYEAEIDSTADADLYNLGARIIRDLHQAKVFDDVYAAAQRVGAPPLAERGLFAFDVSGFMANPDGRTPESAAEDLKDIRDTVGDEPYNDLEAVAQQFYSIMRGYAEEANALGLFKPKVWNERIAPNLDNYVPFMVLDYFTGRTNAGIIARAGTTKGTMVSQFAGQLKAKALIARIQRQKQALLLKKFYEEEGNEFGFADEMEEVKDPKMDREKAERIEREEDVGMLSYWDKGTVKWLKFKDRYVVESIRQFDPDDLGAFLDIMRRNANTWRMMVTVLNPAFVFFRNPFRGVRTSWTRFGVKNAASSVKMILKSIPATARYGRYKLVELLAPRLAKALKERDFNYIMNSTVLAQYALYTTEGVKPSPALQELLDKNILTSAFPKSTWGMSNEDIRNAIMAGALAPDAVLRPTKPGKGWFAKTMVPSLQAAWDFMQNAAAMQEAAPKVSAYEVLRNRTDLTDEAKIELARGEGIPNPGVAGKMNKYLELIFLFWRVSVQGHRVSANLLLNPKTRGAFMLRFAATEIAPKMIYALAAAGVLDAIMSGDDEDEEQVDMQEAIKRLSPYKIQRDDAIPLFWLKPDGGIEWMWGHKTIPENWTPIAMRIPASEEGRWASPASFWLASSLIAPDISPVDKNKYAGEILGGMLPGLNPTFEQVKYLHAALFDMEPPRDAYRNRPIMPEDQWVDGGIAGRLMGIGKNLAAQIPMVPATSNFKNENLPPLAQALLSAPVLKAVVASDNYYGVLDEQRRRYDEKLASAAARNMRGEVTRDMVRRYESLKSKGDDNRTDIEAAEYDALRQWHNRDYEGSERRPGLMQDLREAAKAKQGDDKVAKAALMGQAKDSAAALEASAEDLRELLRELRRESQ